MRCSLRRLCLVTAALLPLSAWAGTAVPFTINLSKPVNVVTSGGTPRIAVDVAGTTRYANYTSGSGTSALVFTYNMQAGDVDLDGVAVSSPVQLNGGTIKDLSGNPLTNLTFTPPNTAGVKVNYPSLGMDFTNGAGGRYTLNGTPYTTLASFLTAAGGSFTRASIGTYFDSAGTLQTATANTPRLDYDPVTHAAKGILIEEARTNSLVRSSEFDNNAAWSKSSISVLANDTASPSGLIDAEKLVMGSPAADYIYGDANVVSGSSYTFSVYLKAETSGTTAKLYTGGGNLGVAQTITLSTDWQRYSVSGTATGTGNTHYFILFGTGYSLTSAGNVWAWGAQVEQGAFPTSYIPTTTAAVTRAADNFTVPTGAWFNANEGSLWSEFSYGGSNPASSFPTTLETLPLGNGTLVGLQEGRILRSAGSFGSANSLLAALLPTINRSVFSIKNDNTLRGSINGGSVASSPSYTHTTATIMSIGGRVTTNKINGHTSKLKYYPARVPDTQLQLMTQ